VKKTAVLFDDVVDKVHAERYRKEWAPNAMIAGGTLGSLLGGYAGNKLSGKHKVLGTSLGAAAGGTGGAVTGRAVMDLWNASRGRDHIKRQAERDYWSVLGGPERQLGYSQTEMGTAGYGTAALGVATAGTAGLVAGFLALKSRKAKQRDAASVGGWSSADKRDGVRTWKDASALRELQEKEVTMSTKQAMDSNGAIRAAVTAGSALAGGAAGGFGGYHLGRMPGSTIAGIGDAGSVTRTMGESIGKPLARVGGIVGGVGGTLKGMQAGVSGGRYLADELFPNIPKPKQSRGFAGFVDSTGGKLALGAGALGLGVGGIFLGRHLYKKLRDRFRRKTAAVVVSPMLDGTTATTWGAAKDTPKDLLKQIAQQGVKPDRLRESAWATGPLDKSYFGVRGATRGAVFGGGIGGLVGAVRGALNPGTESKAKSALRHAIIDGFTGSGVGAGGSAGRDAGKYTGSWFDAIYPSANSHISGVIQDPSGNIVKAQTAHTRSNQHGDTGSMIGALSGGIAGGTGGSAVGKTIADHVMGAAPAPKRDSLANKRIAALLAGAGIGVGGTALGKYLYDRHKTKKKKKEDKDDDD